MCCDRASSLRKGFLHVLQLWGFLSAWVAMWSFSLIFETHSSWQISHLCSLCATWTHLWFVNAELSVKALWQVLHVVFFSLCRAMCPLKPVRERKDFPQMLQLCVFRWLWRWLLSSSADSEPSPQTPQTLTASFTWFQACFVSSFADARWTLQTLQDRVALLLSVDWICSLLFVLTFECLTLCSFAVFSDSPFIRCASSLSLASFPSFSLSERSRDCRDQRPADSGLSSSASSASAATSSSFGCTGTLGTQRGRTQDAFWKHDGPSNMSSLHR